MTEGFDVAFRAGPVGDDSLVVRPLGRTHVHCYASPSYLERHEPPRKPADLAAHDCIVYAPLAPGGRWMFRTKQRTFYTSVRGRLVVNSMPLALDAAVRGIGVARLPEALALDAVRRGKLVALLGSFAPPPTSVFVAYPSGAPPPRVRAFLDLAAAHLAL